jgi:tryptophan synthase alpha subunit
MFLSPAYASAADQVLETRLNTFIDSVLFSVIFLLIWVVVGFALKRLKVADIVNQKWAIGVIVASLVVRQVLLTVF